MKSTIKTLMHENDNDNEEMCENSCDSSIHDDDDSHNHDHDSHNEENLEDEFL